MSDDLVTSLRSLAAAQSVAADAADRIEQLARECAYALDERELLIRERDNARAVVWRLRASNKKLYRALYEIAGRIPFSDDPWTIAINAMKKFADNEDKT